MAPNINKQDKEVAQKVGLVKMVRTFNKLTGKLCNICRLKAMAAPRKMNNLNKFCEECKPTVKKYTDPLLK